MVKEKNKTKYDNFLFDVNDNFWYDPKTKMANRDVGTDEYNNLIWDENIVNNENDLYAWLYAYWTQYTDIRSKTNKSGYFTNFQIEVKKIKENCLINNRKMTFEDIKSIKIP